MNSSSDKTSGFGLRGIRLFAGLDTARLDAIAGQCRWRSHDKGQTILARQDACRDVYLLVAGRVHITTYAANGRQVTFGVLGPGESIGSNTVLDDAALRLVDVVALEPTFTASLAPADFTRLLHDEPTVAFAVIRQLSAMVRRLGNRVFDMSTLGVQGRLYVEILRMAQEAGIRDNTARIERPPTHAAIASRVGTYREQVTRDLSVLARSGLLQKDGRALVVRDVEGIEARVEEMRQH
ncbi:MAG: Crp/Fnr family transcriptional regulator [Xylophilus ampelinus]